MDVRPTNDWILVSPNPDESVSDGGIFFPSDARRTVVKTGLVKAVGSGKLSKKGVRVPLDVKVGDTVAYVFALEKTHTGESIKLYLGTDEFMIRESDVLYVVEE